MTQPKHTPLPYSAESPVYIQQQNRWVVNICAGGEFGEPNAKHCVCTVYGQSKEEAEANAALICKAVNNHDKLVEALRSTIEQYEHILLHDPSYKTVHSTRAALEEVKAALKEAEGGEG